MGSGPVSLLDCARRSRSPVKVAGLLSRAQERARCYARLLADWPALVDDAQREVIGIEERLAELRGKANG